MTRCLDNLRTNMIDPHFWDTLPLPPQDRSRYFDGLNQLMTVLSYYIFENLDTVKTFFDPSCSTM